MSPATSAEFEERIRRASELAAQVKALEPQYDALARELVSKRTQLAELLGMDATADLANAAFGRGLVFAKDQTLTSKVLAALEANQGKPMRAEQVAQLISAEDANIVRSLLSRLASRTGSKVKKIKKGQYTYSS